MSKLIGLIVLIAVIVGIVYLANDRSSDEKTSTKIETPELTNAEDRASDNAIEPMMEDGTIEESGGDDAMKKDEPASAPPASPSPTPVSGTIEIPKAVEVIYTDTGFSPVTITIERGASVKFINQSSGSFSVASDPHPQHTNYAAFDQWKTDQRGQKEFIFIFTQSGGWNYHNHLNSIHFGTVVVE